jgi:hypothetical protein
VRAEPISGRQALLSVLHDICRKCAKLQNCTVEACGDGLMTVKLIDGLGKCKWIKNRVRYNLIKATKINTEK